MACCCSTACCCCGQNSLSMSTSNPNASVNQAADYGRGCGGASCVANTLNTIGKWGNVLLAQSQGKAVATGPGGGVAIGARGSQALPGQGMNSTTLIVIILVIGAILFVAMRR